MISRMGKLPGNVARHIHSSGKGYSQAISQIVGYKNVSMAWQEAIVAALALDTSFVKRFRAHNIKQAMLEMGCENTHISPLIAKCVAEKLLEELPAEYEGCNKEYKITKAGRALAKRLLQGEMIR